MTRIVLLTGGSTPERNVALAGAGQALEALRGLGHEVTVVDTAGGALSAKEESAMLGSAVGTEPPSRDELRRLRQREKEVRFLDLPALRDADLVFILLHGRQGEGGEIQAQLDSAGIAYSGSGLVGSVLAMDKDLSKRLFRHAGVPTADWLMWPASEDEVAALGYPVVVKPSNAGSSVGLTVAETSAEVADHVGSARQHDREVMIEAFLPGREFTVGMLADRPLAVGEIITRSAVFDYEAKYTPGKAEEQFPAKISADLTRRLRSLAELAHRTLKLRDFSRIDFRLGADGEPNCLEANTLPGLTSTSLLPQSALAVEIDFATLCGEICRLALRRGGR